MKFNLSLPVLTSFKLTPSLHFIYERISKSHFIPIYSCYYLVPTRTVNRNTPYPHIINHQ